MNKKIKPKTDLNFPIYFLHFKIFKQGLTTLKTNKIYLKT